MIDRFRNLGFLIAATTLSCLTSLYAQPTVHITGNIKGLQGGRVIFGYELDEVRKQDSVQANSDIFSRDITLLESVRCTLTNSINGQMRIFLMEKGSKLSITGEITKFFDLRISGSKEQDILEKLKESIYGIPAKRPQPSGNADLDKELKRSFASRQQLLKDSVITAFIKKNNIQVAASIAIFDAYVTYPNRAKANAAYSLLSPEIRNSYYGQRIKTFIDAQVNTSIGSRAADFALADKDGNLFGLNDFKHRYLLLDFWASWCGPCRLENPNLVKAYNKYQSKGFEIVGLSMDSSRESWLRAVQQDGLTWKQLNDPKSTNGKTADRFGVKSLPSNFLIDSDGKIVARDLRGNALEEKLRELLK